MHDAANQSSHFRLAIAPGVPSSRLSALLALQRMEEPEITIAFFEATGNLLLTGLHEGRYDAGLSLGEMGGPALKSQPLWAEDMAVATPLRSPLLSKERLTIDDLQDRPLFRWQAEICPLLDRRLSALMRAGEQSAQHVTSFEMMALWVAAGYGIGLSARPRIEHAHGWGIAMRPICDGPYKIVTHLQQPHGQANPVTERFERRALQIAKAGAA